MRNAAAGDASTQSADRNDGHHSIVSDVLSLIEHIQASIALIEAALEREAALGNADIPANIVVLDDVTPRYMKTSAALRHMPRRSWRRASHPARRQDNQTRDRCLSRWRSPAAPLGRPRLRALPYFPDREPLHLDSGVIHGTPQSDVSPSSMLRQFPASAPVRHRSGPHDLTCPGLFSCSCPSGMKHPFRRR